MAKKKIGELLLEGNIITPEELEKALKIQDEEGGKLGEIIIELGFASEEKITDFLSHQHDFLRIDLDPSEIDTALLSLVPKDICLRNRILPYKIEANRLIIVTDDPLNQETVRRVEFASDYTVLPAIVEPTKLDQAFRELFPGEDITPTAVSDTYDEAVEEDDELDVETEIPSGDIVKYINMLIVKGIRFGASDIHIEKREEQTVVRYRIDGVLHEKFILPIKYHERLVSRIKILASMDIAEKRLPQGGSFRIKYENHKLGLRAETIPTVQGEDVCMRFLSRFSEHISLDALGLSPIEEKTIKKHIFSPSGMIIVTGPTGSGKTTTLYSILKQISSNAKKIITLEDPVEYSLPLINQIQINKSRGFDFSTALRSVLRMDPDIIFIGEIRDEETANVAVRAAYTGHLVLTTLHTQNAFEAALRLVDLNVAPFLLHNAINLIISQRLVRQLCPDCKQPAEMLGEEDAGAYEAKGCRKCNNIGYIKRIGVFELLPGRFITRDVFEPKPSIDELITIAKENGIETLWEKGLKLVRAGVTSYGEILRTLPKDRQ